MDSAELATFDRTLFPDKVSFGNTALPLNYAFTPGDTVVSLTPAWPWAAGYAIMGLIFLLARWVTVEGEGH